jgi:predicted ATPase/DNA-binding SARP family transcriptional activator
MLAAVLTVAVLGRVEARRDGVPASVPAGLATELLVRLALDAGRSVRVDRLLDDLWPDAPGTSRNTLQAKVSQLRRALGDPGAVTAGAAGYALAVDPAGVDALEALRLADEGAALLARGDAAAAAATCRAGLDLFGPDVLPAVGEAEWARPHRTRLEEARLRLVEDELAARLQLGVAGEVTGVLEALVAAHPLRERLWTLLVTALYRAGRQSDALAAHRRVTRLLADELGVDPGPELAALERQVLVHDRALAGPQRRGNVPALAAPLVGRADALAALQAALDTHRLVTLVGPAGVGKTRLAVEVARHVDAPDGAWLVRLEGARTGSELPAVLADAVPSVEAADVPAGLRAADLLLVLDNCEHLADDVAALATCVLDAAPRVRVLATSQRPLGLDGELVHALAPLPEADAVALFAQRATARGAVVAADSAPDIKRLCRALDHLPLAIELAAARARVLTVPEIVARLGDRFTLLADASPGRPARRRTLAAALAWSYDLLTSDDRRGLWALAAFPDGATLAGVEHVLAALAVPGAALDVVDRLVERSLVTVEAGRGATRYRLLDSVRAFAAERAAEAGAADVTADALIDWVVDLADAVRARVRGPDQAALVAATATERATVDAALDRARHRRPTDGLCIAVGLGWAWVLLDDIAGAAGCAPRGPPPRTRPGTCRWRPCCWRAGSRPCRATCGRPAPRSTRRPPSPTTPDWRTSRADTGASSWSRRAASPTRWPTSTAAAPRPPPAATAGRRARARCSPRSPTSASATLPRAAPPATTRSGSSPRWATPGGLLHAEAALGRVAHAERRFADAARHHASTAARAADLGFHGAAALHLAQLGQAQHEDGDAAATETLWRAVAGAERAGDLRLLATTRVALARVLLAAGDRDAARALLEAADRWYAVAGAGDAALDAAEMLAGLRAGGLTP